MTREQEAAMIAHQRGELTDEEMIALAPRSVAGVPNVPLSARGGLLAIMLGKRDTERFGQ